MPRIKVSKPASEDVAKYPREYTVFTQIPGALDGEVEAEVRVVADMFGLQHPAPRRLSRAPSRSQITPKWTAP